ncbi:MAG: N-acetylmuramoyl-L-alanine amidase [Clostridium sp.]|nr:N-acetylmuramoyl-L-alanine amidase [Clostridium sp.]
MNNIRKIAIFLVMVLLVVVVVPSKAWAISYKDMPKQLGSEVDKIWTIKFNEDIDKNTINSSNIIVLNESNSQVNAKVEYKDSRTVLVSPVGEYEPEKNYTLIVNDSVKSAKGTKLKEPTRMVFTTKNKTERPVSPKGYVVALDAGRAANDIGSEVGPTGIKGKDINLDVALKAGKILEANGVRVVYTRTEDNVSWSKEDSIAARSKIANDAKASVFVSIHCNAYSSTNASGSETYYLQGNTESKKLASYIQDELPSKTGLPNRGIIESTLKTLSSVNSTAVYVDLGFITNPVEEKILNSSTFKTNSGEAIANAVLKYLDAKQATYIKSVKDISVLLYKGEKYTLPTTVDAVMSDNTDSKVSVKWDKTYVDTSKEGTYYYKGAIAGYNGNVTLKVTVTPQTITNKPKVCIDPSSAANLLNSVGPTGVKEKDVNLAIALKLGNLLQSKGIEVVYTRKGDTVPWNEASDIEQRTKIANESGAGLFVRVRANYYTKSDVKGIETYHSPNDTIGKVFAENVQDGIISQTSGVNRGVKEKTSDILEGFNGTGILVYPGFISNPDEEKLLNTPSYQDKIAAGIAEGIVNNYTSSNDTIKSVNDITVNVSQGDKYYLPMKVAAVNTDGKTVQADVVWETTTVDTSKLGTVVIRGRVKNYDKQINLTINVSPKSTARYKVAIDPGHGGYDSGAVGPKGTKEKDITLAVSLKLGDILVKNGVDVVFTRTSDNVPWPNNKNVELQTRCDIANNAKVDYFVSIHTNSVDGSPTTSGIETFYDRDRTNGIPLAKNIQAELISEFGAKDRGIKSSGLYVVKHTNAPAVLVELEFLSNPQKEQMFKDPNYQQKYAEAIARGIMKTLGK